MKFDVHTIETAPEASRPLLEQVRKRTGMIPNMLGQMAASPATLQAYLQLGAIADQTALSRVERQVVMLTASYENNCEYCMAAHSAMAVRQGVDREVVDALREGRPLTDARLETLRRYTQEVVRERGWVADATLAAMSEAGFTRAQLLDVITIVTYKTLTNYVDHLTHGEVDAPFEAWRWSRPAAAGH